MSAPRESTDSRDSRPRTVVLLQYTGIGDVIWHIPYFEAVARTSQGGRITLVAQPSTQAKVLLANEPWAESFIDHDYRPRLSDQRRPPAPGLRLPVLATHLPDARPLHPAAPHWLGRSLTRGLGILCGPWLLQGTHRDAVFRARDPGRCHAHPPGDPAPAALRPGHRHLRRAQAVGWAEIRRAGFSLVRTGRWCRAPRWPARA